MKPCGPCLLARTAEDSSAVLLIFPDSSGILGASHAAVFEAWRTAYEPGVADAGAASGTLRSWFCCQKSISKEQPKTGCSNDLLLFVARVVNPPVRLVYCHGVHKNLVSDDCVNLRARGLRIKVNAAGFKFIEPIQNPGSHYRCVIDMWNLVVCL